MSHRRQISARIQVVITVKKRGLILAQPSLRHAGELRCATSVPQNGDAPIHIKRIYVHTRNLFFLVGSAELKLRSRLMIVSKNEALREPDRAEQAEQTSSDTLGNACVKTLFLRRPPQHPLTQVRMARPSKARPPPFGPASRIPRNNGDLSLG
jgi:hypothetical protein